MNWLLVLEVVYILAICAIALRIIYDTQSTSKTLAYLLLVVFLPLAGAIIYFSVGINYRNNKIYSRKLKVNTKQLEDVEELLNTRARANMELLQPEVVRPLATLLLNDSSSPFTLGNTVKLLVNGEEKFPELFAMLDAAEQHIHLEYYIVEPGAITDRMKEILLRKASEGVQVRYLRRLREPLHPRKMGEGTGRGRGGGLSVLARAPALDRQPIELPEPP